MILKTFDRSKQVPLFKLEQITSEDGFRKYITPNGDSYKSVTTKLKVMSDPAISRWKDRIGPEQATIISGKATRRGKTFHDICDLYMKNDPTCCDDAMPDQVDLFVGIKKWLDSGIERVYGNEFMTWCDVLLTAGTVDVFCKFRGKNTILDFKTSKREKKEEWILGYLMQCTAYAIAMEERYSPVKVPQIAIVIANCDAPPQLFVRQTDDYRERVFNLFVKGRLP